MATDNFSGNSNYELQATISRNGRSVSVTTIRVRRKTGTGYWTNSGYPWSVDIGSTGWSGSWTYDFTGGVEYQTVTSSRSATKPVGSTFTVRVQVSMGSGIGSATISQSVSIPDVPNAPGAPTLSDATTSQFDVAWSAPSNGGASIEGYDVQVNTSASATGAATWSQGTSRTRTITGRTAGQVHYVRVRAKNEMGNGDWSGWSSIATLPVAPASVAIDNQTTDAFRVTYSKGSNGSSILEYEVQYNTSASAAGAATVSSGTSLSRTITGRNPGQVYAARVRARTASGWGAWSGWASSATLPEAPADVALTNPTVSSLTVAYTQGGNGNGILEYEVQHNATATDVGATTISNGTALNYTITGLNAGTARYARARARTAAGWGAWSGWAMGETLPSTPPGMTILPAPSGTQAQINLSPPEGVTSVTRYLIETRRGSTGAVTQIETTSTSATRTGLQPGIIYQYRASAFIGTYQTPWSGWVSVLQPNPTWAPGDYLAGSLAAGLDVVYAWTGTANASTSTATGKNVRGWFADAGAVLHRITGGLFGTYAARLLVKSDTPGQISFGMSSAAGHRAEVSAGGSYVGSAYVRPMRALDMRAELTFLNGAGATISTVNGAYAPVAAGEWTRLVVQGTAPVGAVYVVVRLRNAAATPLLSGDIIDADGVMITIGAVYRYFDGDTPDTADFDYAWVGDANASPSTRTALDSSGFDPLLDPDCPPLPQPPTPPAIAAECIDEVGTWRRYWSIVPASEVALWLALIPTFTLRTTAAVGQVRIRVYENPSGAAVADLDTSDFISEQLVTFIPGDTELVIDGVSERTRARVGGGDWLDADHLLQGAGGGPATWPVLSCGIGYVISYDVPLDQPDGNMTPTVALTRRQ